MLLVLTVFPYNTLAQIQLQMVTTLYVIGFIAAERPYVDKYVNWQEIINEIMVWLAAFPLLIFTTWIWDKETIQKTGWILVSIIALNVLFNIIVISVIGIKGLVMRIRLKCTKRKNLREFKKKVTNIELERKQALQEEAKRSDFI